jgi:hypothetical protein
MSFFYITVSPINQVLYSRIAISLWKSSKGLGRSLQMKNTTPLTSVTTSNAHPYCRHPTKCEKRILNPSESEVRLTQLKVFIFEIHQIFLIRFPWNRIKMALRRGERTAYTVTTVTIRGTIKRTYQLIRLIMFYEHDEALCGC